MVAVVTERQDDSAATPREFEASYHALEVWGQSYEVIHQGGYPAMSIEARMMDGQVGGGGGIGGHRILAPRVPGLAWETEQRVQRMPPRMARVVRMYYGRRLTREQIGTALRCSTRTVGHHIESAGAWLSGFEAAARG